VKGHGHSGVGVRGAATRSLRSRLNVIPYQGQMQVTGKSVTRACGCVKCNPMAFTSVSPAG